MWQRIKKWREKREDTKLLQYSMYMFRSIYPGCSEKMRACLAQTLWDTIREYGEKWDPDLAQFYYDEVHRIITIYKGLSV